MKNKYMRSIIIIIRFFINAEVQGQHPHQWAPFQVAGLLHAWHISHQMSSMIILFLIHNSCALYVLLYKPAFWTVLYSIICNTLMLSTLGKNSADNILKYPSYFSQKTGFDFSCKLSPLSKPFSGEKQEKISSICPLLN